MKTNMASAELIQNLEEIAKIKKELPYRSRGWCSELGLYVQMREARGMARLQAGGQFRSRIDLWRESPNDSWQVRKYRPGEWERLVEPSLELARWLKVRGGLPKRAKKKFQYAIKSFSNSGNLVLPERYGEGRFEGEYKADQRGYNFCDYIVAIVLRTIVDSSATPISDLKLKIETATYLTVYQLLLGMSMARRYPIKAESVLLEGRLPSRPGPDMQFIDQYLVRSKGLKGDKVTRFLIENDFETSFEINEELGHRGRWILDRAIARLLLAPAYLVPDDVDLDTLHESLYGAFKDGIGFITFLPNKSHLDEFEQRLKTFYDGGAAFVNESMDYVNNTELVEDFLDNIIEAYEKSYGVIQ